MASESVPTADGANSPATVDVDGATYTTVNEGQATILVPEAATDADNQVQNVFYNPIQQFNRDLTVLCIKAYHEIESAKRKGSRAELRIKKAAGKKRKRSENEEAKDGPQKEQKIAGETDVGGNRTVDQDAEASKDVVMEDMLQSDLAQTPAVDGRPKEANGSAVDEEREAVAAQGHDAANGAELHNGSTSEVKEGNGENTEPKKAKRSGRFRILDALSASGLRALRYAHELPFVTSITANDLSLSAVESIKRNVTYNGLNEIINVTHDDARALMYTGIAEDLRNRDKAGNPGHAHKFDVIDLDPYGTAAPFFDAAIQNIRDTGGLLCVTCTDASVWAGHSYGEKCFDLYGGLPVKGLHSHEVGLRIILYGIATAAARYSLSIEPLLSLSIDFYARIFIRVTKSQLAAKYLPGKSMIHYNCEQGCGAWTNQFLMKTQVMATKKGDGYYYKHTGSLIPVGAKECEHCGTRMRLTGPMYGGPIHSNEFIQKVLDGLPSADPKVYETIPRIEGMLQTALDEFLPSLDEETAAEKLVTSDEKKLAARDLFPFFFLPSHVAHVMRCQTPEENFLKGALIHLGYRVTRSHCKPGSLKTDAPWSVIWRMMRLWIRQKAPIKMENVLPHMACYKILGLGEAAAASTTKEGGEFDNSKEAEEVVQEEANGKVSVKPTEEDLWETLVFDDSLKKLGRQRDEKKLVRYQQNPRKDWGPMTKAKGQ
jgi:tRNA (guanine26-N2/guanine27-N2)-dimethyltransferase